MPSTNEFLKKPHQETEYTPYQLQELAKCAADPIYFIKNYVYIQHATLGKIKFNLYPYQEKLIRTIHNNRNVIALQSRQTGKTQTIAIYLFWYAIFNEDKTVVVASNKMSNATEILHRVQYSYEELPDWLKPGVKEYNKTSIEFDNSSRFFSQATTADTGRGKAVSRLYVDEIAFIRKSIQDELWASVSPTLSTGGSMIISSTPNGDNELFANLWRGAKLGNNGFVPFEAKWDEVPGRDCVKFKQEMIGKIGELKFRQEFENEFLSSDPLLINSIKLQQLKSTPPLFEDHGFKFWMNQPDPTKTYYVGCDISVGLDNDYSTVQVLEFPTMKQVAEFRSNSISPQQFYVRIKWILNYLKTPTELSDNIYIRNKVPEVYWSFENNGVGAAIVALLQNDEKFPEAVLLSDANRFGMVTSGKSKLMACLELKRLVEKINGGLQLCSDLLITELKNYVSNGKTTYHAKPGATDDLIAAMLVVMNVLKKAADYEEEVFELMYNPEDEFEDDEFGGEPMPIVM